MTTSETAHTDPQTSASLPPAGSWVFDNDHSSIEAVARHLMVSKVRGRFEDFEGVVEIGDGVEDSRVDVTIHAASINTNAADRDVHLRSADFLDADNHPALRFESDAIEALGDRRYRVTGRLTIRGSSKPVELDVDYLGLHTDPWGNEKAVFAGATTLTRADWDMTWNQTLEAGGVLVGKELEVELNVQLQRASR